MRPRRLLILALLFAAAAISGAASDRSLQPGRQQERRDLRLVLLLTVDQFRFDYLTRFREAYDAGIARLAREGAVFLNAHLEHYPTVTGPGHAAFASGAMPSTSGIIGNDWFDRESGKSVTSVSDEGVRQLGGSTRISASPHRLQVTTIADEVKLAARARAATVTPRTIGISLKDRSAILPVGRTADAAYWFDTASGEFVSSTFYLEALPLWVRQFNDRKLGTTYAGKPWPFLAAPATARSLPSTTDTRLHSAIYASPFGNELLVRLAEATIDAEQLGQRGVVDVFSVSFSSNDSVGHTYGPDSAEVRAISLQTDRAIGALLAALDKRIGLERVLVVFTSDHGVAPLPEVLAAQRLPGGRLAQDDLFGPIRKALEDRFGPGQWILATAGSSPYLNYGLMKDREIDPASVRAVAATAAASIPQVARVYTRDQLLRGNVPSDTVSRRVLQSFHPQRSGDLEILLHPFWIRQQSGTTHGTPYPYDSHIPLVFFGHGIRPGQYAQHVALNDVAATLATMLGVAMPSGSVGRVLSEILTMQPAPITPRTSPR
jgi:Type I phosphodiesterase / nucleotide pyrophosphatase